MNIEVQKLFDEISACVRSHQYARIKVLQEKLAGMLNEQNLYDFIFSQDIHG